MDYVSLLLYTLLAWLLHIVLSGLYRKRFKSTKVLSFRLVHGVEIFLVTGAAMALYLSTTGKPLPFLSALAVVAGTLVIADIGVLILSRTARRIFDIYHFLVAYLAVAFSVFLFFY